MENTDNYYQKPSGDFLKKILPITHSIKNDSVKWMTITAGSILKVFNLWPTGDKNCGSILITFHLLNFALLAIAEINYTLANLSDIAETAYGIALSLTVFETTIRQILLIYHKKRIANLLNTIYYEFWNANVMGEELKVKLAKRTRFLFTFYATYGALAMSSVVYSVTTILTSYKSKGLPLSGKYYEFWKDTPFFPILCIWWGLLVQTEVIIIWGCDILFASLIWNCIAQLRLLKAFFKHFVRERVANNDINPLIQCVLHHNRIIGACKEIEHTFTLVLLSLFLINIATICVSTFILTISPNEIVLILAYLVGHFCQLFSYCYLGQQLKNESTELSDTIYECDWHLSDSKGPLKQHLLIMILRSQKGLFLTAGGFAAVNLSSFMSVVKLTFSFYTFLSTIVENGKKIKQLP